jgi:ParB family chromosome partitioning protein
MVVKRSGLGRNLSALLSHSSAAVMDNPNGPDVSRRLTLAVERLQPGKYQPRGEITDDSLIELTESIKQQGLLQPLVVREISPGQYEIIAGERRWRACQRAGLVDVPVVIKQVDDETAMAIALIENLQREDLNAMEQAFAMQRLVSEFDLTHQHVAQLLCKSRTAVSNYLRLLNLTAEVRYMLQQGQLDMGHARSLLMLSEDLQIKVAEEVVTKGLSVRETEARVARLKAGKSTSSPKPVLGPLLKTHLKTLSEQLQTPVTVRKGKAGSGSLIIQYDSVDRLENMMERLLACQ